MAMLILINTIIRISYRSNFNSTAVSFLLIGFLSEDSAELFYKKSKQDAVSAAEIKIS
jgi:hypothetical protein